MQKLDRLVWAAGLSIHSFGRRIGVRTNAPEILERVWPLFPPGWEPCFSPLVDHLFSLRIGAASGARVRNYHLLYGGFTRLSRSLDLDEVLNALEDCLERIAAYGGLFQASVAKKLAGDVFGFGNAVGDEQDA